jgi:hypothetical protein
LAPLSFLGFGRLKPTDIWVVLALIQSIVDEQDPNNYAHLLYRERLEIGSDRRASVLVVEGRGDSLVPNHATHSLVREFGSLVQIASGEPAIAAVEFARGPVRANVDARTSAGFYQFVPQGIPGVRPTPGCTTRALSKASAQEGHYCVQSAPEALRQRVHFFRSALTDEAPEIIDPVAR